MPTWMPDIITARLDATGELTADIVNWLVENIPEDEQLDYKSAISDKSVKDRAERFCNEVAAFANHRGGLLLYGVKENGGARTIVGIDDNLDNAKRTLTAWIAQHMTPIAVVDFSEVTVGGAVLLAVSVPPSPGAPHAVNTRTIQAPEYRWPQRHGSTTRHLSESEIADHYARRFRGTEERSAHADRVEQAGIAALKLSSSPWLYLSVTPDRLNDSRLDQTTVRETVAWASNLAVSSPGNQSSPLTSLAPQTAPGRTRFTLSDRDGRVDIPIGYWMELYRDGSAFAGAELHAVHGNRAAVPIGPGVQNIVDDLILSMQAALRWVIHRAGPWGSATVRVGLAGYLEITAVAHQGRHTMEQLNRVSDEPARAELAVDLSAVTTTTGRMALVHAAATQLLHHFNLAECPMTTSDGHLRLNGWDGFSQSYTKRWADENDVTVS